MIVSLREPTREFRAMTDGLSTRIIVSDIRQHYFVLRTLYFLLIGWWFSGRWPSGCTAASRS